MVKNAGKLAGKHTIELYTRYLNASVTPNKKRLRSFKIIFSKAGESQMGRFAINKDDLAFVNSQLMTITEPGDFVFMIEDTQATFS